MPAGPQDPAGVPGDRHRMRWSLPSGPAPPDQPPDSHQTRLSVPTTSDQVRRSSMRTPLNLPAVPSAAGIQASAFPEDSFAAPEWPT